MSNTISATATARPRLSVKVQTLATLCAVVAAVALPQLFHWMGAISGTGTALGATFLPMHLPIMLVGLLAGPYAGAVSGLLGPVVSFALTGMPNAVTLPFMMIELCIYGLTAGLLRNTKLPTFAKLVITQVAGRAVRAGATVFAVYALGNESIKIASIWLGLQNGVFGIALQWAILPLLVYRMERLQRHDG